MAFVTVRIKGAEGYSRVALGKDRLVVGRASASDIPIKHTSISREHFALVREEVAGTASWFVEDLGSSNGTWLNKERVQGRSPLTEQYVIKGGKARLTFHAGAMDAPAAAVELSGDDEAPDAPSEVRQRKVDDPPEAIACADCDLWFSIAHRLAGESMSCPRCGKQCGVPELH